MLQLLHFLCLLLLLRAQQLFLQIDRLCIHLLPIPFFTLLPNIPRCIKHLRIELKLPRLQPNLLFVLKIRNSEHIFIKVLYLLLKIPENCLFIGLRDPREFFMLLLVDHEGGPSRFIFLSLLISHLLIFELGLLNLKR